MHTLALSTYTLHLGPWGHATAAGRPISEGERVATLTIRMHPFPPRSISSEVLEGPQQG